MPRGPALAHSNDLPGQRKIHATTPAAATALRDQSPQPRQSVISGACTANPK